MPDGPTIKYSQGMQNSCIISPLASALDYMGDELASEYWMPCEYFMVGLSGTRSFFLLDLPIDVNALDAYPNSCALLVKYLENIVQQVQYKFYVG